MTANFAISPELMRLATPRMSKYCPHRPTIMQTVFLLLDDKLDVFYGGAAGGGKSDAILMAALQYVDFPGYEALILRSTFKDLALAGAIMDRAESWLVPHMGKGVRKVGDRRWEFDCPNGGKAGLTFGYLDGPNDHYQYRSAEFQFIGVDEASQLRWFQMMYMFSRLRKLKGCPIPLRFRLASNPGGQSHEELKTHYVDDKTRDPDKVFIPAKLDDNPHLDESYEANLKKLDWISYNQLRNGDWNVTVQAGLFKRQWFQYVDQRPARFDRLVRFWDCAATKKRDNNDPDWAVGALCGLMNGELYILNIVRLRETPAVVEAVIKATAEMDGAAIPIRMEEEGGSAGKIAIDQFARKVLIGYNFKGIRTTGDKLTYAAPLSAYAEQGHVFIVKAGWTEAFVTECEEFPMGAHDDQVDAASKAYSYLAGTKPKKFGVWGRKTEEGKTIPEPRSSNFIQPVVVPTEIERKFGKVSLIR